MPYVEFDLSTSSNSDITAKQRKTFAPQSVVFRNLFTRACTPPPLFGGVCGHYVHACYRCVCVHVDVRVGWMCVGFVRVALRLLLIFVFLFLADGTARGQMCRITPAYLQHAP